MPRRSEGEGAKTREPTPTRVERPRSPLYRGFAKVTFSIRPDQLAGLRTEARRRADLAGSYRSDASAIVREALDAWLKRIPPSTAGTQRGRLRRP